MDIIGKYKVIKELGAGGFGAVYLAQDPRLGTLVAIKVFRVKDENMARQVTSATSDASEVLRERFLNEARTLRQLNRNPHVVDVFDFDELEDGTPYYVMPYLPKSLKHELGSDATEVNVIAELPAEDRPRRIALNQAMSYLTQLLLALKDVHNAGLVHRDIKPANLLLNDENEVQLCDFGIAKLPDADHSQSGVGMGSRNYMSPEQRQSAKHVDVRSDIYSVGVIAYRMLTGTLPEGRFADPNSYNPQINDELNQLILKALEQTKDKRFADAGAMLAALKKIDARSVNPRSGVADDDTGTVVDNASAPSIKPELQPLQEKIISILRSEGEIAAKHNISLKAMAAVAGLSPQDLQAFIASTETSLKTELQPLRNWLALLNSEGQSQQGKLDQATHSALLEAGRALGKTEQALQSRIDEVCGQYQQESQQQENPTKQKKTYQQKNASPVTPQSQKARQPSPPQVKAPSASPVNTSAPDTAVPVKKTLLVTAVLVALGLGGMFYQRHKEAAPDPAVTPRQSAPAVSTTTPVTTGTAIPEVQVLLNSLVDIPGGSFAMGSNASKTEQPIRRVTIKPFQLMAHEVTFAMWDACVADGGCAYKPEDEDWGWWGRGNRPVIRVSWQDITDEFIPWLNNTTGKRFRLPTEAEWEYAARAGTTTAFSTGNCIHTRQANYNGNYGYNNCGAKTGTYLGKTAEVRSYPANPWGLYDMHGNVHEWVQDCWNDSYDGAPTDGSAWMAGECNLAVLRGGHWDSWANALRSADRDFGIPTNRPIFIGFRLAQGE